MDKSNTELILEARTILHLLHNIAADSGAIYEDICRDDMVHLLYIARLRLDALVCED